jgi:hypothetical protein
MPQVSLGSLFLGCETLWSQRNLRKGERDMLVIDSGWREVAETALAFVKRFA